MHTTEIKDVLLAEDDKDDVLIFELAVEEAKLSVDLRHANDGEKLFVMLEEYIPDILFLDIQLPCKDGITCILEIRKNKDYDNLPVVMCTSHVSDKYIDESFRNGANLYMIKSRSLKEMAENLKRVFSINWKTQLYYPPKNEFVWS